MEPGLTFPHPRPPSLVYKVVFDGRLEVNLAAQRANRWY